MRVIYGKSGYWSVISCSSAFRRRLNFVFSIFVCFFLSLLLTTNSAFAGRIPISDTVSRTDPLLKQQGGGSPTASGDYVSTDDASADGGNGLNGPFRYYIEVVPVASRLVVDIFDADVGMGGTAEGPLGRDRQRGGTWNTSVEYRLYNPSGTQVTTNFTTGNATGPTGSDNAWLTLYDSSSLTTAPQYIDVRTATSGAANGLTVTIPPGNVNDLLILAVSKDGASLINTPAGWTPVGTVSGTCPGTPAACYLGVFYRLAQAGDASVIATWSDLQESVGGVLRYRGVDTSNPIDVSGAATGTSAFPTAPTVTTTVANTRVVRIMGADDNDLPADPYPTGHTGRFALENATDDDISGAAADTTQVAAQATGTAAFDLDPGQSEEWRAVTVALRPTPVPPQAGHWLLEVDSSASAGDDVIGYGIRAHDGTPGSGGIELNIYADPFITYGVNSMDDGSHVDDIYTTYPYITGGGYNASTGACTISANEFDMDTPTVEDEGQITIFTRSNRQILDIGDNQLSTNNTWSGGHETSAIDGAGPYYQNKDNGIFRSIYTIGTYPGNANYTVYYCNNYPPGTPPRSLNVFAYRHYFPTDAGVAPVKPYLEQELTYVSGENPPTEGGTTVIQNTVRIVNPMPYSITFGGGGTPPKLVSVTIPDLSPTAYVLLYSSVTATSGTTIVTQPGVGNYGLIEWDPGTIAGGQTKILTYQISVRPNNGLNDNQVIYVTGQPQPGNGTKAVYLDETGNTSQARATVTFGLLCGLAVTEGGSITYVSLSSFRAYTDRGKTRVEWETSGEAGTVGFILTRLNESSQKFEPVHDGRIRGLMTAPQGGTYSVIDPEAVAGGQYTYKLIEIQSNGGRNEYGPFEVLVDGDPVDLGVAKESSSRSTISSRFEPYDSIWKEPKGVVREARKASQQARLDSQQVPRRSLSYLASQQSQSSGLQAKLAVKETGLYELTASQIADVLGATVANVRKWIREGSLLITNRGSTVKYLSIDNGDALQFFGEAIDSLYTQENIYWVAQGADKNKGEGLMKIQKGAGPPTAIPGQIFTETLHIEQDKFAGSVVPVSPGKDFWYWEVLSGGSYKEFDIPTPGVAPNGEATFRVHVQGAISGTMLNEHQATIYRNNSVLLGTQSFDNLATQTLVYPFSSSILAESNKFEVLSSISSGYYVDGFDLSYPRYATALNDSLLFNAKMDDILTVNGFSNNQIGVFDITNPSVPTSIEAIKVESFEGGYRASFSPITKGGRYLVLNTNAVREPIWFSADAPSSLKDAQNEADYLIIAPEVLSPSAEALATYRASNSGLLTHIALLEDIYDEFNHGIADPYAIRAFLQHAYVTWQRVPRYVVLLGKGTYDYKDVTQQGTNLLPPIMTSTPEGMFASDNRFADVVGNDGIPEYALGRIPVMSNGEFNTYLAKLKASESYGGSWGKGVLLTAEVKGSNSDFKADAQDMAETVVLARGKTIYEIYLDDEPLTQARTDLQNILWTGTVAVMAHVGHGGMDRLATGGLLTISDVKSGLSSGNQLPFLIALSCLINRYEVPEIDPMLGESLIVVPNGGASAVWAPTGTSIDSHAAFLGEELFKAIYTKRIGRVGDAVVEAMRSFRNELTVNSVMLDVYTLLGDPAALIAGQPVGTQQGPSNPIVTPVQPPVGE